MTHRAAWTREVTAREVREGIARLKTRSKYGAVKTTLDGITFDSKREAARWSVLQQLVRLGEVRDVQRQVPYRIDLSGQHVCTWIADFEYWERRNDEWHVVREDCKGVRTPVYRLKKKLVKAVWGFEIRET
jgi:hypothetical protein